MTRVDHEKHNRNLRHNECVHMLPKPLPTQPVPRKYSVAELRACFTTSVGGQLTMPAKVWWDTVNEHPVIGTDDWHPLMLVTWHEIADRVLADECRKDWSLKIVHTPLSADTPVDKVKNGTKGKWHDRAAPGKTVGWLPKAEWMKKMGYATKRR